MTDPLELIAEGRHSIEAVCIESKMSILELAAHVCTAQNLETLARVKQLHDLQREMLLGKLKRDALVRLAELTDEVPSGSADEIRAFEVMRRACVDILRFGNGPTKSEGGEGPGGGGRRSHGYHADSITPASEAEVLEALERWGEEINDYEPRAPGKTPGGDAGCFNETARDDVTRGSLSPIPQGQAPKTPLAHATRCGSKIPVPPESPPHPESQSRFDSQPREGPRPGGQAGESGADTSGSLSSDPLHHPRPPPRPPPRTSLPLMSNAQIRSLPAVLPAVAGAGGGVPSA